MRKNSLGCLIAKEILLEHNHFNINSLRRCLFHCVTPPVRTVYFVPIGCVYTPRFYILILFCLCGYSLGILELFSFFFWMGGEAKDAHSRIVTFSSSVRGMVGVVAFCGLPEQSAERYLCTVGPKGPLLLSIFLFLSFVCSLTVLLCPLLYLQVVSFYFLNSFNWSVSYKQ